MNRILDWETPIKLLPAVEQFFKDVAPLQPEPWRSQFANIRESLKTLLCKVAYQPTRVQLSGAQHNLDHNAQWQQAD